MLVGFVLNCRDSTQFIDVSNVIMFIIHMEMRESNIYDSYFVDTRNQRATLHAQAIYKGY